MALNQCCCCSVAAPASAPVTASSDPRWLLNQQLIKAITAAESAVQVMKSSLQPRKLTPHALLSVGRRAPRGSRINRMVPSSSWKRHPRRVLASCLRRSRFLASPLRLLACKAAGCLLEGARRSSVLV